MLDEWIHFARSARNVSGERRKEEVVENSGMLIFRELSQKGKLSIFSSSSANDRILCPI